MAKPSRVRTFPCTVMVFGGVVSELIIQRVGGANEQINSAVILTLDPDR
jgi:hypothetical protein